MEWELSLYLIAANMPINHKCIYSARKRQKQEHDDHELVRVQTSVPRGKKGTGRWERVCFLESLDLGVTQSLETKALDKALLPLHRFLLNYRTALSLETSEFLPCQEPARLTFCPELLPFQHWSLLRHPEVKSEVASVSLPMNICRQGRLPRAPWIFPVLLGLSCILFTQDPIPSSPGSEARL